MVLLSMTIRTRRIASLVALAAVLPLAACAGSTAPAVPAETSAPILGELPNSEKLASVAREVLDEAGVPGGAVLVTAVDGSESLAVFGEAAPSRAVDAGSVFAYRSITKSFVGTVILQLAEEGRLDLDEPVSEYVAGVPGGDEITLAQLGTMRSGLPNYSATQGLGELLSEDPSREPAVSELLDLAFAEPAVFAAGSAYKYSNTNTLLLGEVIESVTGDSWQIAMEQRILRPLGMDSASYGFTASELDAAGFQLQAGEVLEQLPVVAPGWFGAAGGLVGDIEDLAAWGRALGSGSLLQEGTQQERLGMFGPIDDDPASPFYDRYGFAMGEIDGWIGHTGTGLGFQALTMYDPGSGREIAILINGTGEDPDLPAKVFKAIREL